MLKRPLTPKAHNGIIPNIDLEDEENSVEPALEFNYNRQPVRRSPSIEKAKTDLLEEIKTEGTLIPEKTTRKAAREIAKQHTPIAIRTLVEIAEFGNSETARVNAANSILDRAWGKPRSSMELDANVSGAMDIASRLTGLSDEELRDLAIQAGVDPDDLMSEEEQKQPMN